MSTPGRPRRSEKLSPDVMDQRRPSRSYFGLSVEPVYIRTSSLVLRPSATAAVVDVWGGSHSCLPEAWVARDRPVRVRPVPPRVGHPGPPAGSPGPETVGGRLGNHRGPLDSGRLDRGGTARSGRSSRGTDSGRLDGVALPAVVTDPWRSVSTVVSLPTGLWGVTVKFLRDRRGVCRARGPSPLRCRCDRCGDVLG